MDFHTLIIVHGIVLLTCCSSFIILAIQFRHQAGTLSWAVAMVLIAAGLFSLSIHAGTGALIFAILGNALPLMGFMRIAQATRKAIGWSQIPLRFEFVVGLFILISVTGVTVYADQIDQLGGRETAGWFNRRAYYSALLSSLGLVIFGGLATGFIAASGVLKRRAWTIYFAGILSMTITTGLRAAGLLWLGPERSAQLELLNSVFILLATAAIITITIGAVTLTAGALYWQLKQTAIRDHQTALLNRRGFFELLPGCLSNRTLSGPCSLIVADIDRFKRINDSFGHDVGDRVIAHMAQVLSEHARKSDLVARFGGEEFVLALPGTRLSDAETLAERLRDAIEGSPVEFAMNSVSYTASFGVARQVGTMNFDSLFKRADDALLAAKTSGRNRVERCC
jgi:diguanylate cyclase (GGDEF)-like protein